MYSSDHTVYYTTPVAVIGQHEWVLQVYENTCYSKCTRHLWRRIGASRWRDYHEWPTYDFNDGTYAGLPADLIEHYRQHRVAIEQALGIASQPPDLFDESRREPNKMAG